MKRFLPKSEFSKNVATMLTGNILAQFLPLLVTPILSRMFSVEEFGLLAFYSSLVTFFLVVAAGRYETAILLPKADKDAVNILTLSFLILSILCFILVIITFFFEDAIIQVLNKPDLKGWIIFIPLTVFLGTAYRIMTFWSNRKKRFRATSISSVTQSTSRAGINIIGGLYRNGISDYKPGLLHYFKSLFAKGYIEPTGTTKLGMGGLIIGSIVGYGLGSVYMVRSFFKKDRELLQHVTKADMLRLAKKHDKFPKINAVHALVDEIKNSGVTFVISYLFSEVILGFYSMTFRVLTLPLTVIGSAFGQVFLQKAAEMHAHGQSLVNLMQSTVKKLALIAMPIFLPIVFFGPQIFSFVLGKEYAISGEYAQLLTPWLYLNFIINPIIQIAVIVGKQKEMFKIALVGNAIIFGSIFTGGYFFKDLKIGFIVLTILEIIYYIWIYRWVFNVAKNAEQPIDN
jgi:O-antigen/teichoic acid export membrane protein